MSNYPFQANMTIQTIATFKSCFCSVISQPATQLSFQQGQPASNLSASQPISQPAIQSAKVAPSQKTKLYPPARFLCDSLDVPHFLLWQVRGHLLVVFAAFISVWKKKMAITGL